MTVLPMGPRALLVDVGSVEDVRRLYAEVQRRRADGNFDLVDVVPAARTVLLQFAANVGSLADEVVRGATATPPWAGTRA